MRLAPMLPWLGLLLGALCALPAAAQDVELELVLLADASGSIDQSETQFQRQGYASAITSDEVLDAIGKTAYGVIAVTYVEWASAGEEDVVVPWMLVDGPDSAARFAGPPVDSARAEVLAAGITINGLAILCRSCNGRPASSDLAEQYRDRIIGGPGAFVVAAESRETFAMAVRRKLILEIGGIHGGPTFALED